jgi:hypothetical protein
MSKKTIVLLTLVVILVGLLSGCGQSKKAVDPSVVSVITPTEVTNQPSSTPSPTITTVTTITTALPDQDSPKGYVLAVPTQAAFIRWTDKDKQLSGQLQIADLRDSKINSASNSFTGTQNGSDINITFTGSVWTDSLGGMSWTGTLKDKVLSLVVPGNDGKLNTVQFRAGTVEDYNNAVTDIQNKLSDALNQAQAAKAEAQKVADQKSAAKALSDNLTYLKGSIAELANFKFDSTIKYYSKHLQEMQTDYKQLKADASVTPFDSSQLGTVQSDLGTMESDWGSIQSDVGSMQSDTNSLNGYIAPVQRYIKELQDSWDTVQKMGASTNISQDDLTATIKTGNDQIGASLALLMDAQQQAASYESQAKQILKEAEKFVSGLK